MSTKQSSFRIELLFSLVETGIPWGIVHIPRPWGARSAEPGSAVSRFFYQAFLEFELVSPQREIFSADFVGSKPATAIIARPLTFSSPPRLTLYVFLAAHLSYPPESRPGRARDSRAGFFYFMKAHGYSRRRAGRGAAGSKLGVGARFVFLPNVNVGHHGDLFASPGDRGSFGKEKKPPMGISHPQPQLGRTMLNGRPRPVFFFFPPHFFHRLEYNSPDPESDVLLRLLGPP